MDGKRYKLRYLPMFEEDLTKIIDYITLQLKNPIAAENLLDEVRTAIHERTSCAEAFEPYHSRRDRQYSYYRIYVKNYVVFYVVIGDIMEVRRILYSRRNLQEQI